jgi:hypothetical protein
LRAVLSRPHAVARALGMLEASMMRRTALVLVFEGKHDEARAEASRADSLCRNAR